MEAEPRVGDEGLSGLPERGVRHVLHIILYWTRAGPGYRIANRMSLDDERPV